ncbi:MAG: YggS family pyridoxal phosphate-dependent enzyme [Armatimonadota bacterium]|nr:YggS family pyridoxal phosphate-dependent enzyme [Armatimonadota bacterium]
MNISDRIELVRERILRAGGSSITLIAASKGASSHSITQAFDAGITCFGENYLQEALAKRDACPRGIEWHFIGRLQSNKVAKIADNFNVIQTVDSVARARKVSDASPNRPDVFLEVNIAEEPNKAGILPGNVAEIAEIVYALPRIRLIGLMTMGPANPIAENSRPYFKRMRELIETIRMEGVDKLSMGMTADYEVAIQEGATHIRIGSGLFGPRT